MRTFALVASSSPFRRLWYHDRLPRFGIDVGVVKDGIECIEMLRHRHPDIVILETSLLWGGTDGVMAIRADDSDLQVIPVVLVDVEGISPLTYRLARYQFQSFLVHAPTIDELVTTVHLIRFGIFVNSLEDEVHAVP